MLTRASDAKYIVLRSMEGVVHGIILAFGIGSYLMAGIFRLKLMRIATYDPYSPDACALALWDELPRKMRVAHLISTAAVVMTWPFWRLALLLPQQEKLR